MKPGTLRCGLGMFFCDEHQMKTRGLQYCSADVQTVSLARGAFAVRRRSSRSHCWSLMHVLRASCCVYLRGPLVPHGVEML